MTQDTSINEGLEFHDKMIHAHQRRLRQLELTRAEKGGATDPQILTEIEDIRQEIQQHEKKIEDLRRRSNLITLSLPPVPIFDDKSYCTIDLGPSNVVIDFKNGQGWSGVAFPFTPALDVRGFTYLEIRGTASQTFKLSIEYKVHKGSELEVVTKYLYQLFPATSQVSTIPIPMAYDGKIDEITLMFYVEGEESQVTIESIRLSE